MVPKELVVRREKGRVRRHAYDEMPTGADHGVDYLSEEGVIVLDVLQNVEEQDEVAGVVRR